MIGMDFISFIILLIISIVVSGVLHFVFKFYIIPGWRSYASKVLIGWVGAWLGSPVFGYWWSGLNYKEIYIIPAILGSLAILVFAVDIIKTCATVSKSAG
ncbi:MAG: GlsB/YeaQ/YmgE family stress response membrane protein [Thermodesulfobacteriota bacterium]|nr:GlsB/YeaQ/YmgE family stress response membrane protein [Thermodesulfobacteriota bacterium]